MNILLINGPIANCGVYQYGQNLLAALQSGNGTFHAEGAWFDSAPLFLDAVSQRKPDVILYNWHPLQAGWIADAPFSNLKAKQVLIYHDRTAKADQFDAVLHTDPTVIRHGTIYPLPRPLYVPTDFKPQKLPEITTVGVHGFAGAQAGLVVQQAAYAFKKCRIRLHSPQPTYADPKQLMRNEQENLCRSRLRPGVELEVSRDYLNWCGLLEWLSGNHINVYIRRMDRQLESVSSALDAALCCGRPLAINRHPDFRHLWDCVPSICLGDRELMAILNRGTLPVEQKIKLWSGDSFREHFSNIILSL